MKDERIQATAARFAATGFFIWFFLLCISLDYRVLVLKQRFHEFWDIGAIFAVGVLFVFAGSASKGLFDHSFWRMWLTIGILVPAGILGMFVLTGLVRSLAEAGGVLLGSFPAMGLVIAIAWLLNRRWKRKEGLEDEK